MSIDWNKYSKIRAMHTVGVSDHQIARTLGVGRRTVAKYRDGKNMPKPLKRGRSAPVREAAEGEIKRMLAENAGLPKKQRRSAHDIWVELISHGIAVSEGHVRRLVRDLREAGGEEFIPLRHEMGAAAQFDWGDAVANIAGTKTVVSVFVAVLPFSGAVCAFAYPDKTNLSFFHGNVRAFEWFGGVPRQCCVYDNLRSAVLSGYGKDASMQERFKRFAAHYGFEAEFCNIASGWEKSNVENGVKIMRRTCFVPVPHVDSWVELQKHIDVRLLEYNMRHRIQGEQRGIWENLRAERAVLKPLPVTPMETTETVQAKVWPDQTVIYDRVRYSVPHGYVGVKVTLLVSPFEIAVYCRGILLHTHQKAREKGDDRYILDHYLDVLSRKPRATGQALPIVAGVMPSQCRAFLESCPSKDAPRQLVELMLLAREIGQDIVFAAMDKAQLTGRPTAELVKLCIENESAPGRDITVNHTKLSVYDSLIKVETAKEAHDGDC
jgi:transposase